MKHSKLSEAIKLKYASGWSPRKGKFHSDETKAKISKVKKAQHIVPKSAFKKGQKAWNKGMTAVWTTNRNLENNPSKKGDQHWNWSGDQVTYRALHKWVVKVLGQPDTCEHCGKSGLSGRQIHWANISRKYLRDKNDWIRLCVKCHKKYDKHITI